MKIPNPNIKLLNDELTDRIAHNTWDTHKLQKDTNT